MNPVAWIAGIAVGVGIGEVLNRSGVLSAAGRRITRMMSGTNIAGTATSTMTRWGMDVKGDIGEFGASADTEDERRYTLKCETCPFETTHVKKAMEHVGAFYVNRHKMTGKGPYGSDVTIELVDDDD